MTPFEFKTLNINLNAQYVNGITHIYGKLVKIHEFSYHIYGL